ncbi:MAG: proton-conducting transporter membrane subunit [bacterium]
MINTQIIQPLTSAISPKASLVAIIIMVPFIGAALTALSHKNKKIRNTLVVLTTLFTLALVVSLYQAAVLGITIGGHLYKGMEYNLPSILGVHLDLGLDGLGFLFALITAFVWTLASLFATSYMSHEHAQGRFFLFMLLTFGANMAVFLTRDFFSLFVFFELMTLFSYVLVIHEESKESMAAGRLYILMSIIGGLLVLGSIFILFFYTGTTALEPLGGLVSSRMPIFLKYLITFGFIAGFGIKAGIFFLHVWLPKAHPIAPTPASAILSGLIVKVGVYGIIRSIYTLFTPVTAETGHIMAVLGYILIWTGILTMFGGMVNALLDKNCKRVLAYSTVSQMGYIVMGIGCALYMGNEGAMGMAGSLYHVINHALFKSALFLTIGVVYFSTRELRMDHLGGLLKHLPVTAFIYLIAAFSIAGFPGLGGFASKTILHHAIVEAYEHSIHFSPFHQPDPWLRFAELVFLITASGTLCYIAKMFIAVFLAPPADEVSSKAVLPKETWAMKISLVSLGLVIVVVGIWPNLMLEYIIGPLLALFGFNPASHAYHAIYNSHALSGTLKSTIPLLYDPRTVSMLNSQVLHNLQSVGIVIIGTLIYFMFEYGIHLFDLSIPEKFSLGYWYAKGYDLCILLLVPVRKVLSVFDKAVSFTMVNIWLIDESHKE